MGKQRAYSVTWVDGLVAENERLTAEVTSWTMTAKDCANDVIHLHKIIQQGINWLNEMQSIDGSGHHDLATRLTQMRDRVSGSQDLGDKMAAEYLEAETEHMANRETVTDHDEHKALK